jgi:hypothetical protein
MLPMFSLGSMLFIESVVTVPQRLSPCNVGCVLWSLPCPLPPA